MRRAVKRYTVLLEFLIALGILPSCVWSVPTACVMHLQGYEIQHHFAGTSLKPRKVPENAQTPTTMAPAYFAGDRVQAVLGRQKIGTSFHGSTYTSTTGN